MLAGQIDDEVESGIGRTEGLGLLPVNVKFDTSKTLTRPASTKAYEIRHGVVEITEAADPFPGGCRRGTTRGTSWHGALEDDEFRRTFLTEIANEAGREFTPAPDTDFAGIREARLDLLGDLVAGYLDTAAIARLIETGPPALPSVLASLHPGG
jgi:adenosylcobyric acid synthase